MRAGTGSFVARGALAAALLVLLAAPCARPAGAGDEPPSAKADPPTAVTSLLAGTYAQVDLVVSARVRVLLAGGAGAPTLVRAAVERAWKGAAEGEITVYAAGPRNTADPKKPMEPWFAGSSDASPGRYVLFLKESREKSGWTIEALFAADNDEGREKEGVLSGEVEIARTGKAEERPARTVDFLLALLQAERPWSRLHGARELGWIAAHAPQAFDDDRAGRLEKAADLSPEGAVRHLLRDALAALPLRAAKRSPPPPPRPPRDPPPSARPSAGPAAPAGPPADPEWAAEVRALEKRVADATTPEARVAAMTAYARAAGPEAGKDLLPLAADPAPSVRARAAILLSEVGARRALPRLLARYDGEASTEVKAAILAAAGILGDDSTVAWVVLRGTEPVLVEARLTALARLGSDAALAALALAREAAAKAVPPNEATVRLVDTLRSPAFAEAEGRAGHPVGPRPPLPAAAAEGTEGR